MRRIKTFAAGLFVLAAGCSSSRPAAVPQGAPSPSATQNASGDVIQRIWTEGMDHSQTMQLAQALFDSVGPRLTGSPGQKAGNDWLVKMYRSWGIEAREEKYGTWRGWRRGVSHIDLVSPRVRTLDGTMLAWSPGTGGKDVTAPTIILPRFKDSTEFVQWLPQARGKYVLISYAKPSCRPAADWTQYGTPESQAAQKSMRMRDSTEWADRIRATGYTAGLAGGALSLRMDAAGVAGVVTSYPTQTLGSTRVFETYNTRSPGIALECEDYSLLYRLTQNNQGPMLRVNADAQLLGEVPVFNTIATMRGTEKPDEYVMLSAHFDSWDGGSGSTDNGTGTLTMMEAMRILRTVYPNPKRTILVGHWSSEEQGLNGSRAWSEDHPEVLAKLQALFNQDNGTGRVQSVSGGGGLVGIDDHLQSWKARLPAAFTDTMYHYTSSKTAPGSPGGTDGAVFACKGTPSFGLGAVGWNYGDETWHTTRDTYDKIVFDDLKKNATLTAMLVYLASEDPQLISRQRVEGTWPDCGKAPRVTKPRW